MPAHSRSVLLAHIARARRRLALPPLSAALALVFVLMLGACASSQGIERSATPGATSTTVVPAIATALVMYKGHTGAAIGVAWSPDGKEIASCGDDGTVQVWNARTGQHIWQAQVSRYAFAVAWSPDGRRIAGAGSDATVVMLDAASGRKLATFSGPSGSIEGLAWSPDGKEIASGSQGNTVTVWNAQTGAAVLTYTGHSDSVARVAWSPDGTRIASASYDGTVQVWDAQTGKTLLTYKGHGAPVWSVAWSPDGTRIASGTGAAGADSPVYAHNSARVWNAMTGQTIFIFPDANKPSPDPIGQSYAVAWSPDGMRLASSDGKIVRLWDATTGKPILQYTGHGDDVFALAWSPDGTLIASASADGTVRVWRPQV